MLCRTPIELVKCKMQVQMLVAPSSQPQKLPGPLAVFMSVIRNTGVRGLWLGHTGTFIRGSPFAHSQAHLEHLTETGGTAAWFSTKEFVASLLVARRHKKLKDGPGLTSASAKELRPWESALSGACAGAAFNFVLFPADTVKSAMQTEEELRPVAKSLGKAAPRPSFFATFKAMYRAQGIKVGAAAKNISKLQRLSLPSLGALCWVWHNSSQIRAKQCDYLLDL